MAPALPIFSGPTPASPGHSTAGLMKGAVTAVLTIAAKTCGPTLAPAASCTVYVAFTPTARRTRSGTLSIADNVAGSPHSVALTGTGL